MLKFVNFELNNLDMLSFHQEPFDKEFFGH